MREADFSVNGRRVRVVLTADQQVYLMFRVGAVTLVQKPDGSSYQIDARGRCSCRGFKYRGACKHAEWNREGL